MKLRIKSVSIDRTYGTASVGVELYSVTGNIEEVTKILTVTVEGDFYDITDPKLLVAAREALVAAGYTIE